MMDRDSKSGFVALAVGAAAGILAAEVCKMPPRPAPLAHSVSAINDFRTHGAVLAEGFLNYVEPQTRGDVSGSAYTLSEEPHGAGSNIELFVPERMASIEHATWDSTLPVVVKAQLRIGVDCRELIVPSLDAIAIKSGGQ